jgi:hypothetical protein
MSRWLAFPVINKRPTTNPIHIQTADGGIMTSTHKAELDMPMLNSAARHVHVVPGLKGCSLLFIARLCDAGYQVHFNHIDMRVLLCEQYILIGHHNPANKLWKIELEHPPLPAIHQHHHIATAAIGSPTAADLVTFAHATLFSPVLSTLAIALDNNYLTNFPGLTHRTLRRHPPQSIPMTKQVTLPKRSSTDLIVASLQDIAHALKNPGPRSPLAPTTPSHKQALEQLITTLTNVIEASPDNQPLLQQN